jgi:hypothetical protein
VAFLDLAIFHPPYNGKGRILGLGKELAKRFSCGDITGVRKYVNEILVDEENF